MMVRYCLIPLFLASPDEFGRETRAGKPSDGMDLIMMIKTKDNEVFVAVVWLLTVFDNVMKDDW